MFLEKASIYGVDLVGSSDPNALIRTDDAVGLGYTRGTTDIVSDFDGCYPWSEMHEVTDKLGNVFIKIPKFYSKITKNSDGTYKHQLSGVRYEGFTTLFIDGKGNELDYVLVGKYEGSGSASQLSSKTGQNVLVNVMMDTLRNAARANGEGYQQYDFLIDLIIKELLLIEFATTQSQGIMRGYVDGNSAAIQTGRTDGVATPSGSEVSNTDGKHAMKYRGIENLWGNTWTFVDGISFSAEKVYVCYDPTNYQAGKVTQPYVYQGDRPTSSGYISKIEPLKGNLLLQYVTAVGGGESSYYCDNSWYDAGGQILVVGGRWDDRSDAGLWFWNGGYWSGGADSYVGGRLCWKPI